MKEFSNLFLSELNEEELTQIYGGSDGVMFKLGRWFKEVFCSCGSGGNRYEPDYSILRGDKFIN